MATVLRINGEMENEYPSEFISFLRSEAERGRDTTLDDRRATAIKYYRGDPYGDEVPGRSGATTRDVSEVVDFLTTGIMGDMLAGGKVAEFETEPETVQGEDGRPIEVDYGEEITAAVHYQFLRKQKGYRILHDSLKAGQLEITGIVKTFAQSRAALTERISVPRVAIDDDGEQSFVGGHRVIEAAGRGDDAFEAALTAGLVTEADRVFDVALAIEQPPVVRDEAVPNEYFRVSPDAVDLDEAIYVGECVPKTLSQMVQLGYDVDELRDIWGSAPADTVVEATRDADRSQSRQSVGGRTGANRELWLHEEYPLYDLNGDGIAERLFVHRIGNRILACMEIDEQPYSGWSPFPWQHRFAGQSVADKVNDIQRIRTVLLRQALDSLYMANAPRTVVNTDTLDENTLDDLLDVRVGGLIRYKGENAPKPLAIVDTSQQAFAAMEMIAAERESRTGITRQSQGMNPDTTNKTATGMAMLQANAQQIQLFILRNFAEMVGNGVFAKRYRLMRRHTPPFRMKIDGKYREIDPSKWPEEIDIALRVGLGTGSKDTELVQRGELLNIQREIVQAGWPIVGPEEVHANVVDYIQAAGLGTPSRYIKDPASLPPPQEQPDPETVKAQGDMAIRQQQSAQDHQLAMTRLELQAQEQRASADLKARAQDQDLAAKREAAALDIELKRDKAAEEVRLANDRYAFEQGMAVERFEFEKRLAREKASASLGEADEISALRPGGEIDQ